MLHENIIVHYNVVGDLEDFDNSASHGNSKGTQVFRPTMHSVKQKCKEILSSTTKPPRFIMDDFEKEQDAFSRETDAVVPRNACQIYNFEANRQNEAKNDVLCLIESLLEQSKDAKNIRSPADLHQPFLRKFCLQSEGQPKFVLFLDQTLKDIERFCCNKNRNTILAFDTTFNIGEYYFTQSTYQNLSLLHQNSNKHPWFPGPVFVHHNLRKEDFQYFWQSFLRENSALKNLKLIGTDECEELYNGIMSQTKNSTHFLCFSHVRWNIEKKLSECLIPNMLQHRILEDIFGETGLINEESLEDYDEHLVSLIEKWNEIEKYHTKNDPPGKFARYFMKFKAELLRSKVAKPVRDGAGYKGDSE